MTYFVELQFENAKFFTNKLTKDFVFDTFSNKYPRSDSFFYKEAINVHHISNVLHVLLGERPVPSLRKSMGTINNDIFEIAKNSYIKLNQKNHYNKSKDIYEYHKEVSQIKKSVYNSFAKGGIITWNRVKALMDEYYDDFIIILNKTLNIANCELISIEQIKSKLDKLDLINKSELYSFIKLNQKTPLYDYFEKGVVDSFNMNERTLLTVNRGIDSVIKLNGTIIVPLDESYLNRLKNHTGICTILDGGLCYIRSIHPEYEYYLDESEFSKVNEISTEKY